MTREIAHFQQFTAALETIQRNFPPGIMQGDLRFTHTYYNMSPREDARGPWNKGKGPWEKGEQWEYVEDPVAQVLETKGEAEKIISQPMLIVATLGMCGLMPNRRSSLRSDSQSKALSSTNVKAVKQIERTLAAERSAEVTSVIPKGERAWSRYDATAD